MGITNESLIHELLEIELPFASGDQVLGVGPMALIRGDRLYTDSDWMDEEFLSAAERYSGPKRSERDVSQPAMLEQGDVEGVLMQRFPDFYSAALRLCGRTFGIGSGDG
jgi:hypothetical protein